jgi:hypothetical protein
MFSWQTISLNAWKKKNLNMIMRERKKNFPRNPIKMDFQRD